MIRMTASAPGALDELPLPEELLPGVQGCHRADRREGAADLVAQPPAGPGRGAAERYRRAGAVDESPSNIERPGPWRPADPSGAPLAALADPKINQAAVDLGELTIADPEFVVMAGRRFR